jgi:hypothetical protein
LIQSGDDLQNNKKLKVSRKRIIALAIIAILLVSSSIGVLEFGIYSNNTFQSGQMNTWDFIANVERNLRNLYSNSTQTELKQYLSDEPMNFTDGLIWESNLLNFSYDRPEYQNATQMIEWGRGACGDFVLIFGAFCVAKDIPFRVIHVGYWISGVVDHSWMQVNPSKDGKTWIQVEVAGACDDLRKGKTIDEIWGIRIDNNQAYADSHYRMILAYQLIENQVVITDVTANFS